MTSDLIEPEGTNAASAESTDEAARPPVGGDVRSGGDAAAMPERTDGVDDRDLTGSGPTSDDPDPTDDLAAQSGQDSGSMQ